MTATKGDEDLLAEHQWGSGTGPEHMGPRHDYRESLILRRLKRERSAGARAQRRLRAPGRSPRRCWTAVTSVTSVDMSEPFVERLREVTVSGAAIPPTVGWADLTEMPFPDDAFDIVVCGEVLEHIPDDGRGRCASCARVLALAVCSSSRCRPTRGATTGSTTGSVTSAALQRGGPRRATERRGLQRRGRAPAGVSP